jgi:hypothetical protein
MTVHLHVMLTLRKTRYLPLRLNSVKIKLKDNFTLLRRDCTVAKSACYLRHVRLSASTRLPLDGFLRNLILATSMKISPQDLNLLEIGHKYYVLYLKP